MTQKPKRKLKNIDFSDDMSHIALVSKHQGGPASGANYNLVLKNVEGRSPEFIEKVQSIQVELSLPDFLSRFFGLWCEDAEILARLLGYVPEEREDGWDYEDYIEERLSAFTIIKSLHEAKSLPDALSKLTEQDYLDILTDQAEIEKALKEFDNKKSDTSTKVESKVEASASKQVKKNKGKQMTQETEMVEKSALTAVEKALEDQKIALEKALAQVKQYEDVVMTSIDTDASGSSYFYVKVDASADTISFKGLTVSGSTYAKCHYVVYRSI